MVKSNQRLATAVDHGRVSRLGDAAILEFLYLSQEWDALVMLREFALLSDENKRQMLRFLRRVNEGQNIELVADQSGLIVKTRASSV